MSVGDASSQVQSSSKTNRGAHKGNYRKNEFSRMQYSLEQIRDMIMSFQLIT